MTHEEARDRNRSASTDSRSPDRRARRLVGRAHPPAGALRGGLPRRTAARARARRQGRPRPAQHHAPGSHRRDPRCLLRRRRGHRDDQHVHGHVDRAGRLRPRAPRRGDEPRGRAPRPCRRRRVDGADARPATLRRRSGRAAQRLALCLAEGRGRRVPRGHLRRGPGELRRANHRARRGRRRPPARRDDLRHPERKSRDRRGRGRRAGTAALALVHRHRPQRPQPIGPDGRSVLGLRRARSAARRRRQLLVGRERDAPVPRAARARRRHVRVLLPERRPAERDGRARRRAGRHEPVSPRLCGGRPRQRRRRVLRHDAGACQADRGRRRGDGAAGDPGARRADALERARAVRDRPRHGFRDDRRADERDGLRAVPLARRGGRSRGSGRSRDRAGPQRRERARRQHGRRPARRRADDDALPQPARHRARGSAAADHGRQLPVGGPRGGAALPPGQGHRQLDLAEGGGGAVPRARAGDPPLRRGGRRDGVRRAGTGRHASSARSRSANARTAC